MAGAETLLARTVRVVGEAGLCPLLVGKNEVLAEAIEADEALRQAPWLPDHPDAAGPIGGLVAALTHVSPRPVVLLAADLPFLDAALLRRFAEEHPDADAVAARAVGSSRLQPLPARFGHAALVAAQAQIARGQHALFRVLEALPTAEITLSEDEWRRLTDLDTPEDVARWFPGGLG